VLAVEMVVGEQWKGEELLTVGLLSFFVFCPNSNCCLFECLERILVVRQGGSLGETR